jgi:hypothetical protein
LWLPGLVGRGERWRRILRANVHAMWMISVSKAILPPFAKETKVRTHLVRAYAEGINAGARAATSEACHPLTF